MFALAFCVLPGLVLYILIHDLSIILNVAVCAY